MPTFKIDLFRIQHAEVEVEATDLATAMRLTLDQVEAVEAGVPDTDPNDIDWGTNVRNAVAYECGDAPDDLAIDAVMDSAGAMRFGDEAYVAAGGTRHIPPPYPTR